MDLKPCPFCNGKADYNERGKVQCAGVCIAIDAEGYANEWNTRPIEDALTASAEKAERERDEARARLAAAREAWDKFDVTLIINGTEDADDVAESMDSALSDEPALAVVQGGMFKCQLDHLQESWPWKDGSLRVYPATTIDDPIDDDKIELAPVTVVVLGANAGGK